MRRFVAGDVLKSLVEGGGIPSSRTSAEGGTKSGGSSSSKSSSTARSATSGSSGSSDIQVSADETTNTLIVMA